MDKADVFLAGLLGRVLLLFWMFSGSYYSDGNVWRIYVDNRSLMIGDFWAASFVIILIYTLYIDIEALLIVWWAELKKYEEEEND